MAATDLFADIGDEYTRYRAELQVTDKLAGGVPKDPDTITKWLRARMELDDPALRELVEQTGLEMAGTEGVLPATDEVMAAVGRKFEGGNGFKTVDGQLVWEGRCAKAALKEWANIAYPGTTWPGKPTGIKKGLMRYLAERVFVTDQYIPLGVSEPSGTEQRIKHVFAGGQPQSAISVVDVVEKPLVAFTVAVLDDFLPAGAWGRIWQVGEEIGIGADRARGDGRFELVTWQRL